MRYKHNHLMAIKAKHLKQASLYYASDMQVLLVNKKMLTSYNTDNTDHSTNLVFVLPRTKFYFTKGYSTK